MNINENIEIKKELNLKKDFTPPTFDEWKQKVEVDLKGALFEKKLVTKTYEDINIQPIYTQKDIKKLKLHNDFPGIKHFRRGFSTTGYIKNSWKINQEINIHDTKKFNIALKNALANGQNSINLTLDTATKLGLDAGTIDYKQVADSGLSISTIDDLETVFAGIDITKYPIIIEQSLNTLPLLSLLIAYLKKHNINHKKITGAITTDPYSYIVENGEISTSFDCIFDMIKHNINWAKSKSLKFKFIGVSTLPYNNTGANAVQELAFAMATAVEYINKLLEKKIRLNDIINNIVFTFGIGTNYFMEIAKFRAARILWNNIAGTYGLSKKPDIQITAKTSSFYQTVFDPYVNMLRTTTEAFSAILGGVESITTDPFDNVLSKSNDFSRRIARNTQIILKEESHLDQVIDASGGSFYIETITKQIADKAWKLFQTIEDKGGMLNSIKDGFIQDLVNDITEKRISDINKRKSVIIGSNMFANLKEEKLKTRKINQKAFQKKRKEYLQSFKKNIPVRKYKANIKELKLVANSCSPKVIDVTIEAMLNGATLGDITKTILSDKKETLTIPKFNKIRASENFEKLRNISLSIKKKTGLFPKVFLANMGSLKEYKARADFSRGFFEVGGFEIINSDGFADVNKAINSGIKEKPEAIIICSTDDNYKKLVPAFTKKMRTKKINIPLILAGYPKDKVEEYKNLGIDDFIFLGADAYKILSSLLNKIGGTK
jgi:methylmalonyl-CoA mutase